MKQIISCFICLIDISRPKKHDSPCNCKPYIHQRCVNKWYKNYPNECPICRINYEDIGVEETYADRERVFIENDRNAKRCGVTIIIMILFFIIMRLMF